MVGSRPDGPVATSTVGVVPVLSPVKLKRACAIERAVCIHSEGASRIPDDGEDGRRLRAQRGGGEDENRPSAGGAGTWF